MANATAARFNNHSEVFIIGSHIKTAKVVHAQTKSGCGATTRCLTRLLSVKCVVYANLEPPISIEQYHSDPLSAFRCGIWLPAIWAWVRACGIAARGKSKHRITAGDCLNNLVGHALLLLCQWERCQIRRWLTIAQASTFQSDAFPPN